MSQLARTSPRSKPKSSPDTRNYASEGIHMAAHAERCTMKPPILGLIWANRSVLALAPAVTPPVMSRNSATGFAAERPLPLIPHRRPNKLPPSSPGEARKIPYPIITASADACSSSLSGALLSPCSRGANPRSLVIRLLEIRALSKITGNPLPGCVPPPTR